MLLFLDRDLNTDGLAELQARLERMGLSFQSLSHPDGTIIALQEDVSTLASHVFTQLPGVTKILRTSPQTPLTERKEGTQIGLTLKNCNFGKGKPIVIAGPCSVEGQAHLLHLAHAVRESGASMLRGGAFKPRTSPYEFQGLGLDGLKHLSEAARITGLPIVSEVMSTEHIELAEPYVDMLQVGARNMYNYELLKELGRSKKPVLLKRALSATISELLHAAEYIILHGNPKVVLCERGIRTFETMTRNTLDLSAVALLKSMTGLPVLVDPSHGTGRRDLVRTMSRAAIACGADGLIIEVHDNPRCAMSDGEQAITPAELNLICSDLDKIYSALQETTVVSTSMQAQIAETPS